MLHCRGGASVVVVNGEMKIVVLPLGGLVLKIGGVNVLLLDWVLVWAVLLVVGVGCDVVVVVDWVVTLREGIVVEWCAAVEAAAMVEIFAEAVVVFCWGVSGDTWDAPSVDPADRVMLSDCEGARLASFSLGKVSTTNLDVAAVNSSTSASARTNASVNPCKQAESNTGDVNKVLKETTSLHDGFVNNVSADNRDNKWLHDHGFCAWLVRWRK